MRIKKEVLIYQNIPYKKYRWISYISIIQVGFLSINLLAFPSAKLAKEHQKLILKKKKENDFDLSENTVSDELENHNDLTTSFYEKIKLLNFNEVLKLKNLIENIAEKPFLSAGLMGASALTVMGLSLYTRRMVHKIVLLPGDYVRISFFSSLAIGKPPTVNIPLHSVSCASPRQTEHNHSILKLKGYYGYHLVNKKEGKILDPQLYDRYLGYERSWAKR